MQLTIDSATPAGPSVPPEVTWRIAPNEAGSHAYSSGPGWTRSVCRLHHWSAVLQRDDEAPRCPECTDLVDGSITESERRLLDGNR